MMKEALQKFAGHMAAAEKYRTMLKTRFGLTDHQIGTMAQAMQKNIRTLGASPMTDAMSNYAAAVLAAKRNLQQRGKSHGH